MKNEECNLWLGKLVPEEARNMIMPFLVVFNSYPLKNIEK